jgi:hypothetical protein
LAGLTQTTQTKIEKKEEAMKRVLVMVAMVMVSLGLCGNLLAAEEQTLIDTVANGCKTEITTYCKSVTPGEGRVLACLFAHEDKLSGQCEYALYDAASRLERAVAGLNFAAQECGADITTLCKNVAAGEGRILECLEKNDAKVSKRCKDALKSTGLTSKPDKKEKK